MKLAPENSLPISSEFGSSEEYVTALLDFVTGSEQFQILAGGVHILDFFTRTPSLYESTVPQDWAEWFDQFEDEWSMVAWVLKEQHGTDSSQSDGEVDKGLKTPKSLSDFLRQIKRLGLVRDFNKENASWTTDASRQKRSRRVPSKQARTSGMSLKKQHEVINFSSYVSELADRISDSDRKISHLVDFGSGANYLGRTLASDPYKKNIVAIESRDHVVEAAKKLDVAAKIAARPRRLINKKVFRETGSWEKAAMPDVHNGESANKDLMNVDGSNERIFLQPALDHTGTESRIQYVHHRIQDGDLSDVVNQISDKSSGETNIESNPNLMVMSLHSCGTLVNHGLRTLALNPAVKAVAMIGCCYNLISERLPTVPGPCDQHGFPMSSRLFLHSPSYPQVKQSPWDKSGGEDRGIRLNITSRMMGVQAPRNWSRIDSERFFTRHYYRALLQKIFLDKGIVKAPDIGTTGGRSPAGTGGSDPIVIGNLAKGLYKNFMTYVRGAVEKIFRCSKEHYSQEEETSETPSWVTKPTLAERIHACFADISDEEIQKYDADYKSQRKNLGVVWTLMAVSAELIEALVVVDRWLWLKEQDFVQEAWVESVWEYHESPRNLVIVGIKRSNSESAIVTKAPHEVE